MSAPGRSTSADAPSRPSVGARVLRLGAALAVAALVSRWAVEHAQLANIPYMGLPPAPPYNPAGRAWFAVAYVPWLVPAALVVRWWPGWRGWGLAVLVGGLAAWFVAWTTQATVLVA
jgi:hypothetical protein